MAALRNVFLRESEASTVPQMMAAYRAVKRALPRIKEKAGSRSLFAAAVFRDIVLATNILKKEEEP
jgi:hypothetical protein